MNQRNDLTRGGQRRPDLAYGSFLFCGLSALSIRVMSMIPMDSGTAGGLGFLVAIPLFFASLAAMVSGIVLSVRLWQDRLLLALSGLSVLYIVQFMTEFGSTAFSNSVPVVYGVVACVSSGVWFLVLRRKRLPRP